MGYMGGTTKESGWALLWFLTGFIILGTAATGGGALSLIIGFIVIGVSLLMFKTVRIKEEA
jgi:hypothetical protein